MAQLSNVILVPGFGGSQLSYLGGKGGKTPLWYSPRNILALGPGSMGLADDGINPQPNGGKALFVDGLADVGAYETVIIQLSNDGWNVGTFKYDWRKDLNAAATGLATYISQQCGNGTFSVVAHSLGGLVAQLAYPLWKELQTGGTWTRTIYMGTPHGGQYWSSLGLCGYVYPGSEMYLYAIAAGYTLRTFGLYPLTNYKTNELIAAAIATWPSVYQALASAVGPWNGLDPALPAAYSIPNFQRWNSKVKNQWFALANTTQAALVALYSQPRPDEISIVGVNVATPASVTDPTKLGDNTGYTFPLTGDGTVPANRASLPGGKYVQVSYGHLDMLVAYDVLSQLTPLINNGLPGDETIPFRGLGSPPAIQPPLQATIVLPPAQPFLNVHGDP